MNWSLLAGGLSKGLDQAFAGANQGLVQGEGIRAGRAQEERQGEQLGLQREQLGMRQTELTNALAQQAFQNRMAQERFGLTREELALQQRRAEGEASQRAWSQQHGDVLRGIQEREATLKETNAPYERKLMTAKTKLYENPNYRLGGRGTETERYKNGRAMQMGYESYLEAPPEVRAQLDQEFSTSKRGFGEEDRLKIAQEKLDILRRTTQVALQNPQMSGADRATAMLALAKMRNYGLALKRISDAQMLGQPPQPQDLAYVGSHDINAMESDIVNLQNRLATRGNEAANPGVEVAPAPRATPQAGGRSGLMQKWGLK